MCIRDSRPSLGESSQIICPRCDGHGRMRSVESLSLSILRLAEEQAMKDNTGQILVQTPPQIANYLLNEKRRALVEIETRHEAPIIIVADDSLETPHFNVSRLRDGEFVEETSKPSYQRGVPRKLELHALTKGQLNVPSEPAVTHVKPAQTAPSRQTSQPAVEVSAPKAQSIGLLSRFKSFVFGDPSTEQQKIEPAPPRKPNDKHERTDNRPNNPRQHQQNKSKHNRPERTEEEKKRFDEQRKLEQQKRRTEQQKRDTERKEAQRMENQRKDAERQTQGVTEISAMPTVDSTLNEVTEAVTISISNANDVVVQTSDALDNGTKRRRGRRGGRRRRRQEGDNQESAVTMANDQSELDFEEPGTQDDIVIQYNQTDTSTPNTHAVKDNALNAATRAVKKATPRVAPVVVSTIPVAFSESDFSDLDVVASNSVVQAMPQKLLPEPPVLVEPALPKATELLHTAQADNTTHSKKAATHPPTISADFVEPKPQQTGYVPVAPPSFSMPSTPSTGYDFTVRINPENTTD
jgi:ribonuclease E